MAEKDFIIDFGQEEGSQGYERKNQVIGPCGINFFMVSNFRQ